MAIVFGGLLVVTGVVLIGLAYHDSYSQAWEVLKS